MTPYDPQSVDPLRTPTVLVEDQDRPLAWVGGLDPDPRHVEPADPIMPAAQYIAGYDAGWSDAERVRPRLLETRAFGCGVVIGMLLAIVAIIVALLATPRSGQTTDRLDMSPTSSAGQSGAPHGIAGLTALVPALRTVSGVPSSPAVANVATSGGLSGLTASTPAPLVSGTATWYRWHPGEAAAGPALRRGLGSHWRGTTVTVCGGAGCTTVRLTDWCLCGHGRVVDLDRRSFAWLADPSVGVLRVTVTRAGLPIAPATDR